ncbi:Ddt domain-containing protein ptm [Thalictrum thalictroides]|uniref:Ddt domain-containing protein ptm n=1 Tax=Thalictrum thalictroides TaxID=46969 RepID=A0A7J6VQ55_THATH|nr:Ddt domain-containing protein ptm [Thalictrum thalictroides]
MELVGKTVKKEFLGLGIIKGIVKSYDPINQFFEILYEDGDSEELDCNEIVSILEGNVEGISFGEKKIQEGRIEGSRPKKKRRRDAICKDDSGNFIDFLVKDRNFEESQLKSSLIHDRNLETLEKKSNANVIVNGFDLNVDISMGEEGACFEVNLNENDSGDENLKENDLGRSRTHKVVHGFDINLDLQEEIEETRVEELCVDGEYKKVDPCASTGELHKEDGCDDNGRLKNKLFSKDAEEIQLTGSSDLSEHVTGYAHLKEYIYLKSTDDIQLKYSNGLSEHVVGHVCLNEDNSVKKVEETQWKARTGFCEHVRDVCLGTDKGFQNEDTDLGGDFKRYGSEDTSAYFHLQTGGSVVVMPQNREGKTGLELPDKETSSRKKRGRPFKKSKSTAQADECVQDRGFVASKDTIAYFHAEPDCFDVVIAEKHEGKPCLEPPDKEASNNKKRGRRPKKAKSAMQTALSTINVGSDVILVENPVDQTHLEPPDKVACNHRKRGRSSEDMKSTTETSLRRSTRRSSSTSLNHALSIDETVASNAASPYHDINDVLDSNFEAPREQCDIPPRLELPPSSNYFNIEEISILEVFSVYSFLRSFSILLFLSPFGFEAFVKALNCKCPNSLIDSIHVSLLHTLKVHLDFLSDEGSQSAANCLRSLNWALLDVVTWPIYMVEYLLLRGSEFKPCDEISQLKVLLDNYHEQSPAFKITILRYLCDDVIESETVRSELNRRTQASGLDTDGYRTTSVEIKKKRKDRLDDGAGSCVTEDVVDENADHNSDECCLCKMDGNLICCDGCPAAYHTRCVGISKDTLPEGDWFCPECVINRNDMRIMSSDYIRGAELLGVDPHGRQYFGTCGYLLVLDSCDPEASYTYYTSSDFKYVIEVLKSSELFYGNIRNAISMYGDAFGAKNCQNSQTDATCKTLDCNNQISATALSSVVSPLVEAEAKAVPKPLETSVRDEDFDLQGYKVSEATTKSDSGYLIRSIKTRSSVSKSETLVETQKVAEGSQVSQETCKDYINGSSSTLNKSANPGEVHFTTAECSLQSGVSCARVEKNREDPSSHAPVETNPGKGALPHIYSEPADYVNYYTFGQIAACVAHELNHKSADNVKDDSKKSSEDIISAQMRAFKKYSSNFCWSAIQGLHQNALKEDCGWCFSCKAPSDCENCLLNMTIEKPAPAPDASKCGEFGLHYKQTRSHLSCVICQILSIEERLSGLLLGPWKNPSHSKNWRKNVLKAPDVASVKHLLLSLEANLRHIAVLPQWLKHVDSIVTMGSASHVLTTSAPVSVKHTGGRKRAKYVDVGSSSTSKASAKSSMFWWRGGRLTRQLFNCKVLPQALAFKGGRQAGCKKIFGISYPDGSEFAKRSRYIAWRAEVEMSTSVSHLAYQVRELDSSIRWDDLENIQTFSHLSKESRKAMKLFKKMTIRRKCIEGTNARYLLDFGKRKTIPDIVTRNGTMLEVSSSERKKFWLEESLVPLHILKAYEEKKLARTFSNMKPRPLDEIGKFSKKPSRKNGILYLLSKGEKSEYQKCGHCNKDVLIRDAVNCQDCEGFFHKRHVRKSEHSGVTECIYTCHRCHDKIPRKGFNTNQGIPRKGRKASQGLRAKTSGAHESHVNKAMKTKPKKGKLQLRKIKKTSNIVRRECLPRKVKRVRVQNKNSGAKKRKRVKSRKQQCKKDKCWFKRRRTEQPTDPL